MKDKDIIILKNLLIENNEILITTIVELMNAQLRCIPSSNGLVKLRTAEEDAEIRKRY